MGDRNNPIKFGPEWLRNLARERSAADTTSAHNTQSSSASATATASGSAAGASGSGASSATASSNPSTGTSNSTGATAKVQLAKLRYGREEMLALYDRNSAAPSELKYIDFLYQPRGKPPFALHNSIEDELANPSLNTRSGSTIGNSGERFGAARGMGRSANVSDSRGRARMPFVRQTSAGRGSGWHLGTTQKMLYNTGTDEETPQRSSWSATNGGNATNRNTGEQTEWNQSKMFRNKRQGQATNWRQAREESDEWRSSDAGRSRSNNQQDKWERDWGDRPNQDKPQSWSSNRRAWGGSESQNNDELPEWAVENAEACGGTFDSSGAFHGYSNDDTNLPKSQDSSYPLARSHTHGSFARSKTVEEGSDEWWASEKAKKLSPKRFDASDIKFKKPATTAVPESSKSSHTNPKASCAKENIEETQVKMEPTPDHPESGTSDDEKIKTKPKFSESKTFDALMRSDIKLEEANDERGNFQSVMITPNNSLRQKHQNIVSSSDIQNRISTSDIQNRKMMYHLLPGATQNKIYNDSDYDSRARSSNEEKIVEELIDMTLEDKEIITMPVTTAGTMMNQPPVSMMNHPVSMMNPPPSVSMMNPPSMSMPSGMPPNLNSMAQMPNSAMHMRISSPLHLNQGLMNKPNMPMQGPGMQTTGMQVGITNSALNASLGLPIVSPGAAIGLPMQGLPPPMLSNSGMNQGMGGMELPAGLGGGPMQGNNSGIPFPTGGGIPGLSSPNMSSNSSLFLSQNSINTTMQNHGNQGNMFPMHGLQHSGSQAPFGASIYGNMMQPSSTQPPNQPQNISEQWYYEDPKKTIQGPFSSKEMYNWYRAGFFTPSLMVRRACDTHMRPLGSYGPTLPFAPVDMMSRYAMSNAFESRSQGPHDNMMSSQQGLGLESVLNLNHNQIMAGMHFGSGPSIRHASMPQPMVDSLWSSAAPAPDMLWMQQAINARNENRVNNLPMYFWDQQPSGMSSSTLLPEEIAKEMKTEDQILAQIRASQNIANHPNMPYMNEPPPPPTNLTSTKSEDTFPATENVTPNLEELHKLMHKDIMIPKPAAEPSVQNKEPQPKVDKNPKAEQIAPEPVVNKTQQQIQNKVTVDPKAVKQAKNESEKSKSKENVAKSKTKKVKEDKKEETELKSEEEVPKVEKRSEESSPSKSKKEDKTNKKELEKEKKEWLKEGFTIVKGPEKNNNKEGKKKTEEVKASEEAERKRKEEEKLAAEEEKKRKQLEALRKQQEQQQLQQQQQQQQQQRHALESVVKKAPWSAVANQSMQATNKDGLTLAEIQRLEREKKLEQMKEQQQMMQIIAQQQAAALAREQEMQAGLGWAKKKGMNTLNMPGQSLAEIQAEARKQQAAAAAGAAAAASQAFEEAQAAQQAQMNLVPWGNTHNGGFWDTQPNAMTKSAEKSQEPTKAPELKPKKKPTVIITPKKESSPAVEFEAWCNTVLATFSSKIDVPTFVGFLKDIESPYEVKDYVKCYLGESKDSGDFARQFLERRSKLLRVGMVTPSDDLCSPAIAVNPRTISGSDYQEVKGKGKKTKKNRMLKVDARILGFSVTASEDRINVGDIDTV